MNAPTDKQQLSYIKNGREDEWLHLANCLPDHNYSLFNIHFVLSDRLIFNFPFYIFNLYDCNRNRNAGGSFKHIGDGICHFVLAFAGGYNIADNLNF